MKHIFYFACTLPALLLLAAPIVSGATPTPATTTLTVTLTGPFASRMKLWFNEAHGKSKGGTAVLKSAAVTGSPGTWTLSFAEPLSRIAVWAFLDLNGNGAWDDGEPHVPQLETIWRGQTKAFSMEIRGSDIPVSFIGEANLFRKPMYVVNPRQSGSLSKICADIRATTVTVLFSSVDSLDGTQMFCFDDLDGNNRFDMTEPFISPEVRLTNVYPDTPPFVLALDDHAPVILPEPARIQFVTVDPESKLKDPTFDFRRFGFLRNPWGNGLLFLIPSGECSDLPDITCQSCRATKGIAKSHSGDHLWALLHRELGGSTVIDGRDVWNAWLAQTEDWRDLLLWLVDVIETKYGLTVYGKVLVGH